MALLFFGKDPLTKTNKSPTVWLDDTTKDLVMQGWIADDATRTECEKTGNIPDHETVIRIPARMVPILREVCDAAERTQLRGDD
ncbi:hypothetical protein [Streptomyces synnematoformans]|uniref:hypothetical protein n=1 Tax=Streptomyces synnematoformans TaxID=415721 RepID=UPI0031CF29CF